MATVRYTSGTLQWYHHRFHRVSKLGQRHAAVASLNTPGRGGMQGDGWGRGEQFGKDPSPFAIRESLSTPSTMRGLLLLALASRAAAAAGTPMPTPRTPPMGWSSWNAFYCSVDEPSVRQNAELLISTGLRDLGYDQLNIDDCWVRLCCIHPCHQPRAQRTLVARTNETCIRANPNAVYTLGLPSCHTRASPSSTSLCSLLGHPPTDAPQRSLAPFSHFPPRSPTPALATTTAPPPLPHTHHCY